MAKGRADGEIRAETRAGLASLLIACAALAWGPGAARGQEDAPPDTVQLVSGNRMVGEVRALYRGELAFIVAGAGMVDIEWRNVERLTSDQRMDVELSSGERLLGTIAAPAPGRLELVTDAGTRTLDMLQVVRIHPIGPTASARTRGSVDFGFNFLGANEEVDLTLHAEAVNRTRNYLTQVSIDSLLRQLNDETAQRRNRLDINSRRVLRDRWFVLGELIVEENRQLGLDSRVLLAAAAGRTLLQTNRSIVSLYGGLAYDMERYDGVPGTEREPEALGAVEWGWFENGGNTELASRATVFVNLDRSRERAQVDIQLRRHFAGSFYWSVLLYESYDSDQPAGLENDDQGISITIGRSF